MRHLVLLIFAMPLLAHDWSIVPGERVGPITAASTEASLRIAFGAASIRPAEIRINKASTAPGLEIYRGRSGESLAVVWPRKDRGLWWPLLVIPCYGSPGAACRWETAAGVRPGLSVADLEKRNGKPFLLYPSSEQECWIEPWWDGGQLGTQLGEDIELNFESPDFHFYAGGAYTPSNQEPLAGQALRIDRMLVFLLSGRRAPPANDWTIVPRERFGPIPIDAAAEPLRETLGAAQVHRVLADADEGLGNTPGISIFGTQSGHQVLLRRDGNMICGGSDGYKNCAWHLAGGIPLSATLGTWERLNGRPFVFNGCCFDLGGIITSWEGGRMAKAVGGARVVVSCGNEVPSRMMGEVSLRSDDPDIRKLKCTAEVVDF